MTQTIKRVPYDHPDLLTLVGELDAYFYETWGEISLQYQSYHNLRAMACALVCYVEDVPVGCGCWKPLGAGTAEMKRMYVRPRYRRCGIGGRILTALAQDAQARGYPHAVLETGADDARAIAFYEAAGYRICPPYGAFVGDTHCVCMEKQEETR